ncbi:MAG: suppressor of fused domain protein [Myxococcota bacterium]
MPVDSPDSTSLLDALEAHYFAHLGRPLGSAPWTLTRGAVELRRYEPVPGILVLATFGVSALGLEPREAVLSLPADPPEDILAAACRLCGAWAEHMLTEPDPTDLPAEAGGDFESVLVLPPVSFTEGLAQLRTPAPWPPLQVVWLVPGFREEAEYRRSHGTEALLNLLRAQRLDPADFGRGPASTLVTPEDAARLAGADQGRAGYKVEQQRGGIRIERRRKRIGRSDEAPGRVALPAQPSPPTSTGAHRPTGRSPAKPTRPGRARFDLDGSAPARPGPSRARTVPDKAPSPPPPQESPEEAKRRKIETLKANARAARARAEARARGEAPEAKVPPVPSPAPEQTRSVTAAERRRRRLSGPPKPRRR